jgi:type 1 glutamine amidotransferase
MANEIFSENLADIKVLIVGGGTSHDFSKWYGTVDKETLENGTDAKVYYTENVDSILFYLSDIDVLILSNNQPMENVLLREAIVKFVESGKGLILAHAALWYNWKDWPEYNLNFAGGGSNGHDKFGKFKIKINDSDHSITKGVSKSFTISDELYYYIPDSNGPGINILATAVNDSTGSEFPSLFTVNNDNARIVGIALGHDEHSHNLLEYKNILINSVKWAAVKQDLN